MSGGWEAGDLALCVEGGPARKDLFHIDGKVNENLTDKSMVSGCLLTVARVGLIWSPLIALSFVGDEDTPWLASRFRKITPPKADEFDREVIDLMLGKPVPVEA